MKKLKVLNNYKLLGLMITYLESDQVPGPRYNNALIRKSFAGRLLKATNFSDIDDGTLKTLEGVVEQLAVASGSLSVFEVKDLFEDLITNNLLPSGDDVLLKKLGVQKQKPDEIGDEISRIFPSQRFLDATIQNFKKDISSEIEAREKKVEKLVGGKGSSVDDSMLLAFNQKLKTCKSFNDIEDLLLYYTTARGGDLINGFLRGDLTLFQSKKPNLESSWGTSKNVSVSLLLDTAIKALELKRILIYGTLDEVTTVYRGLGLEGLLKFIGTDEKDLLDAQGGLGDKRTIQEMLVYYINHKKPIYQTNAVTSTSLDKKTAKSGHAARYDKPILMNISLEKGTAFGKDFSKTSFGSDDYNKEVILKPLQKIRLNYATSKNNFITVDCVTV